MNQINPQKMETTRKLNRSNFIRHQLSGLYDVHQFRVSDVLNVCPYSIETLKTRDKCMHFVVWRHVIMVWARLSGIGIEKCGEIIERDHSTTIHAEKRFVNLFTGGVDPLLHNAIEAVVSHKKQNPNTYDEQELSIVQNQISMENFFYRRMNNMTREEIYPATAV